MIKWKGVLDCIDRAKGGEKKYCSATALVQQTIFKNSYKILFLG
jgi:hypothetical protein